MKALLLAAGYATRLYPLTLDKPKALLPVARRPIIDYILENIKRVKYIDEIFVVTNRKFYDNFREWLDEAKRRPPVSVIDDGTLSNDDRLGAIGDIAFAIKNKNIRDGLLVVGADNIFDAELSDFVKFAVSKKDSNCIGLYDLADKESAAKYGVVSIAPDGKVTDFQEKPKYPESTLISTCVYYFPGGKTALIKKYLDGGAAGNLKDASGNYIKWLKDNDLVYGYVLSGKWYDIGDIESYKKADEYFRGKKAKNWEGLDGGKERKCV